jgi:hypothetical protein
MAALGSMGAAAGLGQHGRDAHRGRGGALAGPGSWVHRADRVGVGQRARVPRQLSETAERRAQRGVALSFWLTAPYIAAESVHHLAGSHHADTSVIGIVLTAVSLLLMPTLGRAKHILAVRLGSAATGGEGTQNYLCGAQAAAVLVGLAVNARWTGGWWFDPVIGLGIAAAAIWQCVKSWRGEDCGC